MLFSTERLYARQMTMDDLDAFVDLQTNPNVLKYTLTNLQTPKEAKADLEKVINHFRANDGFRVWGIFLNSSNEMVGNVAIISNEEGHEIGYRLREKHWGNGYGLEATQGLIKYAFEKMDLPELWAEVDERNSHSITILDQTMNRIKSFWNERDQTQDLLFKLKNPRHS